MSVLGKVKEFLGLVPVKMRIETELFFRVEDKSIKGKLHLTSRKDRQLKSIEVRFEEFYTAGRGKAKSSTTMRLGGMLYDGRYAIDGEPLILDFSIPFIYGKSKNERRIDKGGIAGTIGHIGKFLHNEKSKFRLVAIAIINENETEYREELEVKRVRLDKPDTKAPL